MTALMPRTEIELTGIIRDASARQRPLAIIGGGTRATIGGRPTGEPLSTKALSGITLYEPAEMVISARAGTPLAEIEAALAEHGQMLPFEPMDHRPLLGTQGEPTIGAVAACNISGPRRVVAGAARDHLIGLKLVNGRGEAIRTGGRVMKNVTGLDLVKLNAGAFGTLGVLSEVTFKVLPKPETAATLHFEGLPAERALEMLSAAMTTPFEVSAAACRRTDANGATQTLLRLEGFADSCRYRARRLTEHLSDFGTPVLLDAEATASLWTEIRDARPLAGPDRSTIVRVHVAPSKAPGIIALAKARNLDFLIDWAGGLVWLGLPRSAEPSVVIEAIASAGGHPMVVRGTDPGLCYARPPTAPIRALGARIKQAFDPAGIFNPGALQGHF